MPDNAPVITSPGEAVSGTTLSRTALAALACSALLAGCGQQPETGNTAQEPRSFVQVATVQGEVQGTAEDGLEEYKGIPYAAPPTGDLRWRAPQPALMRDAVLVADDYETRCIQRPATMAGGGLRKHDVLHPRRR